MRQSLFPTLVSLCIVGVCGPALGQDAEGGVACGQEMEMDVDAFSPGGISLGKVIKEVQNADGEPTAFVLETPGTFYGLIGTREVALPTEAVELAGGRAKIAVRDESGLEQFPDYSCE